jgi:predicted negative regulator of RcsB-dependent stress response
VADHMQDEEQVEALKRWWDENGKSTLIAVALAVSGTVGWQSYQDWRAEQSATASAMFSVAMSLREQDANQFDTLVEGLKTEYSGSAYASLAALQLAGDAVAEGDLDAAEAQLRWVIQSNTVDAAILDLATLRLGRVVAAQGDTAAASVLLNAVNARYPVAVQSALGDMALADGREADALAAYQRAQLAAQALGTSNAYLMTKITSLQSREVVLAEGEEAPAAASPPVEETSAESLNDMSGASS